MTREERHRILGPENVAAIKARVARCPKPSPGSLEPIRDIFAPLVQRAREHHADAAAQQPAA